MPLARKWAMEGVKFINLYGPTENTVYSHCEVIPADCEQITIGTTINEHVQQYVVDEDMNLLGPGEKGELLIGGIGVARGYHGKPEMTQKKFISNPFGDKKGRLYRTGDLVVELDDHRLLFHGRIDNQVKLRGFRVELGEVESNLIGLDGVDEACCIAKDQRLVAFVTPSSVDTKALIAEMKQKVPSYLVPAVVVPMDAFPLTPNDKMDRKALAALDIAAHDSSAADFVAPRTAGEAQVCALFGEVLGMDAGKVGAVDSFFDLGGHSLLAMRLVARLLDATGTELDVSALYDASTPEALAALLLDKADAIDAPVRAPKIERARRPDAAAGDPPLAASYAQEQMHLLQTMDASSVSYNCPYTIKLRGELRVAELRSAVEWLVDRHEVLRTTLAMTEGGCRQRIAARGSAEAGKLLTFAESTVETEAEADAALNGEAATAFDLEAGPVVRVVIVHGADAGECEGLHWVMLSMHHAAVDGWSVGVLRQELTVAYTHFCDHQCAPPDALVPALELQYADFAAWQRTWMGSAENNVKADQLEYWTHNLKNAPVLALPLDFPRPAKLSGKGSFVSVALPGALVRGFKALGRSHGCTPFVSFLAAWQLLLARYCRAEEVEEVVCGVPYANRNRAETQGLVGYFVNPLAVRTDVLGAGGTFADLLARVRRAAHGAFAHADVAFHEVVQAVGNAQGGSTPVFQTMLAYNEGATGDDADGLDFGSDGKLTRVAEYSTVDNGTAKFEVTLRLGDGEDGGLVGELEYSTDLFKESSVEYMGEHFRALLHALVNDAPDTPLDEIRMMSKAEEKMVTCDWNATVEEQRWPNGCQSLQRALEHTVAQYPDSPAVQDDKHGAKLTYAELDDFCRRAANVIKGMGVANDQVVAVCVERSARMICGVCSIVLAGNPYLVIDPKYPLDRIQFMLRDTRCPVLLTDKAHRHVADGVDSVAIVCMDEDEAAIRGASKGPIAAAPAPDAVAYCVYTSGSTGRPKGIQVTHSNILNLTSWYQKEYQIRHGERGTQLVGAGFDLVGMELWPHLTAGACLHVCPEEVKVLPPQLLDWLAEREINHCFLPTPIVELCLPLEWPEKLQASLKQLVTGGDKLHMGPPRPMPFRFDNIYAPAECTAMSLFHQVQPNEFSPAIGNRGKKGMVWNTRHFVVDEKLRPLPVGVPGELVCAGLGISRGYLNRPEMNKEKFVADELSDESICLEGARGRTPIYRCGDLARFRPDGSIEFMGRIDTQCKIRGQRIELSEIETNVLQLEWVTQASVLAPEGPGGKTLVAYIATGREDTDACSREVKEYILSTLPTYMVPAVFQFMKELPLTHNGKVDRRALPPPDWSSLSNGSDEAVPPATPTEATLQKLFAEALHFPDVAAVSVTDSFFDLGGHSLSAAQLIVKVQGAFGLDQLPLSVLFECSSARALGATISTMLGGGSAETTLQTLDLEAEALLAYPKCAFEGYERAGWARASGVWAHRESNMGVIDQ